MARRRKRKIKKGLGQKLLVLMLLVLIPTLILYSADIFLKVKTIKIAGDIPYTSLQIEEKLQGYIGQNLVLVNKNLIEEELRKDFPYLHEINITKAIPDQILLELTSRTKFAVLEYSDRLYFIDRYGEILEEATLNDQYIYPRVFTDKMSVIDGYLAISTDEKIALINVIDAFELEGVLDNIQEFEVCDDFDIKILYGNNYQIKLGNDYELKYKLQMFEQLMERLTASDIGIIDITTPSTARFIPSKIEASKYLEEVYIEPEIFVELDEFDKEDENYDILSDENEYVMPNIADVLTPSSSGDDGNP